MGVPCRVVPDPKLPRLEVGYNNHGEWSTVGQVRETEVERGNGFPEVRDCPDSTPAIWVTPNPLRALSYALDAGDADRVLSGRLRWHEREELDAIRGRPVRVLSTDVLAEDDGAEGVLVLRPGGDGIMTTDAVSARMGRECITTGRRAGFCPSGGPSSEAEKRLECLMVGSRIRTAFDSIYTHSLGLADGSAADDEQSAMIIDTYGRKLAEGVAAARKSCGWVDDSEVNRRLQRVVEYAGEVQATATPGLGGVARREMDALNAADGELSSTEDRAIAADPPLFRNLRRVAANRPSPPEK